MVRWSTEGDVVLGQTCQPVGSLCYLKGYKIPTETSRCCGHLKCEPLFMYDASGNVHHFDVMDEGYRASNDFKYCQYISGGAEGQSCVSID